MSPLLTREFWLARWKSPFFRGALLVLATLLVYLPASHCGYIWDDDVYVTENPLLSAPDGLRRIWFSLDSPSQYFPLVYTTFRAEYALWGLNPAGYHWVNILLHIANALLVWRLLERLKVPGAWFAATIFALHPVHVESVAWITERKNVLSVFFFLLALLSWVDFAEGPRAPKWRSYALALIFYALALFAKTTACTLPAALLLVLWLKRERIGPRRLAQMVPFLIIGMGMGLLTVWWERYHQGTQGKLFALGLPERILVASHAVWFYLGKLLWPASLTFSYPHWTLDRWNPPSYGWLLACGALCWVIWRARKYAGRSMEAAILFFVATLSPVLGFIMLYTFRYSFVADHYQYTASIGPIALACAGTAKLAERFPRIRKATGIFGAIIILMLGTLTWRQCHIYADNESIWRDTLSKNPGSLMAHFNLANGLMRDGRYIESLDHYDRAMEIDPTFFEARCNRADVLTLLGRLPEAAADYEQAVGIEPNNAVIENSYGALLRKMGRSDEAVMHFQKAAKLEPNWTVAEKNLADGLASQGNFAGALTYYEDVARAFPDAPQSHIILAHIDVSLNKIGDAIHEYREAIRLAPQSAEALTRLAWLLAKCDDPKLRNGGEAVTLARRACDFTHNENGGSLNTLAAAYAAGGRPADAIATSLMAIDAARNAGDKKSAADFQKQMDLYKKNSVHPH